MLNKLTFDREFKIWCYTVSHGQLLLRSVKPKSDGTRIDVLFKDVSFIHLSAALHILTIEEIDKGNLAGKIPKIGEVEDASPKWFLISSDQGSGAVNAGSVHWIEDNEDYGAPSRLLK